MKFDEEAKKELAEVARLARDMLHEMPLGKYAGLIGTLAFISGITSRGHTIHDENNNDVTIDTLKSLQKALKLP